MSIDLCGCDAIYHEQFGRGGFLILNFSKNPSSMVVNVKDFMSWGEWSLVRGHSCMLLSERDGDRSPSNWEQPRIRQHSPQLQVLRPGVQRNGIVCNFAYVRKRETDDMVTKLPDGKGGGPLIFWPEMPCNCLLFLGVLYAQLKPEKRWCR
jgi:hypothetical protein